MPASDCRMWGRSAGRAARVRVRARVFTAEDYDDVHSVVSLDRPMESARSTKRSRHSARWGRSAPIVVSSPWPVHHRRTG